MTLSTHIKTVNAAHALTSNNQPRRTRIGRVSSCMVVTFFVVVTISGCGAMAMKEVRQDASLADYLYSGQQTSETTQQTTAAELHLPLRCGIAFVPGYADPKFGLTEVDRLRWSTQIKALFEKHPFVGNVVVIPTSYLKSGGGVQNLRQLAALFNVEAIALLSYEQTQFSEPGSLSALYLTSALAWFVVPGDRYNIHTVLEAALVDARSGKLLFRAPATSIVEGSATMVRFSASSREARSEGFDKAFAQLIPNVDNALQTFHRQAQTDPAFRLITPDNHNDGEPRQLALEATAE